MRIFMICFATAITALLAYFLYSGTGSAIPESIADSVLLAQDLQIYADRHNGSYPDGNTSTEVFQKLIDDGEANPRTVWFAMPGKSYPLGSKIEPDNVCFDFTKGSDPKSPGWLPVLIPTGYLINYQSGEISKLSAGASKLPYDNLLVLPSACGSGSFQYYAR